MNLLDENIREDQRPLLKRWRIAFRQIGAEIAPSGIKDEVIIPLLLTLKQATFFTHDQGFFLCRFAHARYCLAWLDVSDIQGAIYIRRFLKHPAFKTKAQRMGVVARLRSTGIHCWRHGADCLESLPWS